MRILNTYREAVPPSDILSPEDILRICCKPTPVDECSEVGRLSPYEGADAEHRDFDEQEALDQARAENPGKRIISVRTEGIGNRPGQPCGTKYEDWTGALNCCEFVEPMVWDAANSVEVLADHTDGWVFVTGGTRPYHWSIRGQGFTFDGWNMRDAITDVPYIRVYAGQFACGTAPIEVTDGCSVVKSSIRSANGQWVDCRLYFANYYGSSSTTKRIIGISPEGCSLLIISISGGNTEPVGEMSGAPLTWDDAWGEWRSLGDWGSSISSSRVNLESLLTGLSGLSIATEVQVREWNTPVVWPTRLPGSDCSCPSLGSCRYIC